MATGDAVTFPDAAVARDHLRSIGHRLTGDVTEVMTCQWRWLFDLSRGRFTRRPRTESLDRAVQFGPWRRLQHVRLLDGDRLEVKEWARPAVRTSLHGATCGCGAPVP